jgi:hypothetical protein
VDSAARCVRFRRSGIAPSYGRFAKDAPSMIHATPR